MSLRTAARASAPWRRSRSSAISAPKPCPTTAAPSRRQRAEHRRRVLRLLVDRRAGVRLRRPAEAVAAARIRDQPRLALEPGGRVQHRLLIAAEVVHEQHVGAVTAFLVLELDAGAGHHRGHGYD